MLCSIFELPVVHLALGLLLLIAANVALGSVNAFITNTWDWLKLRNGCIRGVAVVLALVAAYFAGYFNPDILVIEADGQMVNLMSAIYLTMLAAFIAYAVDIVRKIKDILLSCVPGDEGSATDEQTEVRDNSDGNGSAGARDAGVQPVEKLH